MKMGALGDLRRHLPLEEKLCAAKIEEEKGAVVCCASIRIVKLGYVEMSK